MHPLVILLPLLTANTFATSIEQAFAFTQMHEWNAAASVLDQAYAEDPSPFGANNLHYLRGRIAENQDDWGRARAEFETIVVGNPLRPLAAWHLARAAIELRDPDLAALFLNELPPDFPADMKMQLARVAPQALALRIYSTLTSRQSRFERARLTGDNSALWTLLHDFNTDDVALESARILAPVISTPRETIDVAAAFAAHRQFEQAINLYRRAAEDQSFAAEALFQIARAHFQQQDYAAALEQYRAIIAAYDGSDWQKDAVYQMASCYWRMGDYHAAEKAYLDYIARYGAGVQEQAIRNLVDVYRVLGDNAKATALIDKTLAKRLSTATRQSLLFTKAKVLYTQKRYTNALEIFRQLSRVKLQSTPGGATSEEVRYFEAMSLSNLGQKAAATAIWKQLAADSFSYYGQRAAARLGDPVATGVSPDHVCDMPSDPALQAVTARLSALRHPLRAEEDPAADPVSELIFMDLWDEASRWIERTRRPDPRLSADLAYMAGRYERAINYADRLSRTSPEVKMLIYPAAFRSTICEAAAQSKVDPLWLHAIIWQESKYNPNAASAASAHGLMQFIPDTAEAVAAAIGMPQITVDRLYDPETSIRLGAHYWASLLEEFKEPELALAAYNGGPDNVRRWKDKWPGADIEFFVSDIGFVETKHYVQAVFAARAAYGAFR
jgi:soluble lytic murein transglycosylase